MRNPLQILIKTHKTEETRGFWSGYLRFIKVSIYTMDSKRVLKDGSMSRTLHYCSSILYVCPKHIKALNTGIFSKYNFCAMNREPEQIYAFAPFLGGVS